MDTSNGGGKRYPDYIPSENTDTSDSRPSFCASSRRQGYPLLCRHQFSEPGSGCPTLLAVPGNRGPSYISSETSSGFLRNSGITHRERFSCLVRYEWQWGKYWWKPGNH